LRQNNSQSLDSDTRGAIVNIVETACLLHDIGNPPFGHFGEAAIQRWFRDNGRECLINAVPSYREVDNDLNDGNRRQHYEELLGDFYEFDGNPQGFRLVTRLQWNNDKFGLNLTKTTLATYLKYLRQAGKTSNGLFAKKAGYFKTESALFSDIQKQFF
jgi:dGTPase